MSAFDFLSIIIVFLPAVILHECAHGWMADKLGDPTARLSGRLTLNPLSHIDPFGSILVPAILWFSNLPIFGWAKPVPVNFSNLHHPKRDMMWVGLAGPAVNIVLAVIFSLFLKLDLDVWAVKLVTMGIFVNLVLAVFNMIPIPPLDGSRLLMGLLPLSLARPYSRLEGYGIFIVFILMYLGLLSQIIWPVVLTLARFLGVGGE